MAMNRAADRIAMTTKPLPASGVEAMSESKWTAGPWRLDGNTDGNFYGISADRDGFRGEAVVVWRGIARPCSQNGRANARLIAAAPALYEALSEAVAVVEEEALGLRNSCTVHATGAVDEPALPEIQRLEGIAARARAALSSAHGETP